MLQKSTLSLIGKVVWIVFFLYGCNNGDSTNTVNQLPTMTIQASSIASLPTIKDSSEDEAIDEMPKVLWEERENYQKEGKIVFFTDCGLYKSGGEELSGVQCTFSKNKWIILEPKLEPQDNLNPNGDFTSLVNTEAVIKVEDSSNLPLYPILSYPWIANIYGEGFQPLVIRVEKEDVYSKPYALNISSGDRSSQIGFVFIEDRTILENKIVTAFARFKKKLGGSINLKIYETTINSGPTRTSQTKCDDDVSNEYSNCLVVHKISNDLQSVFFIIDFEPETKVLIDNVFVVLGNFPMGL